MIKVFKILLTVLLASCYFFPVGYTFLPTNPKNILAAFGLVFLLIEMVRSRDLSIPKELIILLMISGMVSIASLISITYNQTPDTTYVTYIRSAVIWLSGAYSICYIIRLVHGRIDVPLVVHYLIGVCLFQCASALLIEFIPAVRDVVDRYVLQGQAVLQDMGRLYGIGASLDVAGSRFSAVLVAIAFLLVSSPRRVSIGLSVFYVFSFVVITVIGNMIARTTTVGALIGILWMALGSFILPTNTSNDHSSGKGIAILGTIATLIGVSIIVYNAFPDVRALFRFGFEGFFSLLETGKWQTDSTDTLASMLIWPEELRTWIIGDGYFVNSREDPNYLGDTTDRGFYMGTDIGYLRFIYYFGIAGLVWIVGMIVYSTYVCSYYLRDYNWMFIMALIIGLAVWAKVSTDIFLFFALFLSVAACSENQDKTKETAASASKTEITP